jgi:ubiquinol-cytochrome c reductase cytochrome c subunit
MPASTTRRRRDDAPVRPGRLAVGWVGSLLGVAIVVALVSPSAATDTRPSALDGPSQVREVGATLYLQNCASCHGMQGEGTAAGPSLVGVGAASADFYLRTGRMPLGAPGQRPQRQEPIYDPDQIAALVEHVASFGPGPSVPQVAQGGDLHRGWQLYQANCAACHGASGSGNAVGGGSVAAPLGDVIDLDVAEAMLVGPGVMPRFDLPPEDRDAVVAYVASLRDAEHPGGLPVGGFGPVAEGFVAVVIGLLGVLLAVRFVGRRSHAGEPDAPLALSHEPPSEPPAAGDAP